MKNAGTSNLNKAQSGGLWWYLFLFMPPADLAGDALCRFCDIRPVRISAENMKKDSIVHTCRAALPADPLEKKCCADGRTAFVRRLHEGTSDLQSMDLPAILMENEYGMNDLKRENDQGGRTHGNVIRVSDISRRR